MDPLDYTMYMAIARFLTTRVESHVEGSVGQSYYPKDMQLPEEEQRERKRIPLDLKGFTEL